MGLEIMNHSHIKERSLIERYYLGQLAPDEEMRFEAHFASCPQCMEQLEMARELQLGLRAMVAEDATRMAQIGLVAWFTRRRRGLQLGLILAALLVVTGLPMAAGYLVARGGQWTTIAAARATADDWQRRYQDEQQTASELRQQLATSELRRKQDQSQAEARVTEDGKDGGARRGPRLLPQPLVNTPVFLLATLRADLPPATIDLGSIGDHLVLAVDAGNDPRFVSYRVTIADDNGTRLWDQAGLLPNALEAVMITFPADFFSAGDYRLTVAGLLPDASAVELNSYQYRVAPVR